MAPTGPERQNQSIPFFFNRVALAILTYGAVTRKHKKQVKKQRTKRRKERQQNKRNKKNKGKKGTKERQHRNFCHGTVTALPSPSSFLAPLPHHSFHLSLTPCSTSPSPLVHPLPYPSSHLSLTLPSTSPSTSCNLSLTLPSTSPSHLPHSSSRLSISPPHTSRPNHHKIPLPILPTPPSPPPDLAYPSPLGKGQRARAPTNLALVPARTRCTVPPHHHESYHLPSPSEIFFFLSFLREGSSLGYRVSLVYSVDLVWFSLSAGLVYFSRNFALVWCTLV